jgi:hypothetical protein
MPRSIFRAAVLMLLLPGVLLAADLGGMWLDIPFVKQEKNGCGAASIAMVMQSWQQQLGQPASTFADSVQILRALIAALKPSSSRELHGEGQLCDESRWTWICKTCCEVNCPTHQTRANVGVSCLYYWLLVGLHQICAIGVELNAIVSSMAS